MKNLFLFSLLFFVAGCPAVTPHPKPVEPTDTPSCATACKKLQDMKCEEGQPLEDGTTCEKFCTNTQQSGHALRPGCILEKVQKCADIQPLCFEK